MYILHTFSLRHRRKGLEEPVSFRMVSMLLQEWGILGWSAESEMLFFDNIFLPLDLPLEPAMLVKNGIKNDAQQKWKQAGCSEL